MILNQPHRVNNNIIFNSNIINYTSIRLMVNLLLIKFKEWNVDSSERIGILLGNSPCFISSICAVDAIDASAVLFSPLFKENELNENILKTEIRIILTTKELINKIRIHFDILYENNDILFGDLVVCKFVDYKKNKISIPSNKMDKEFILQFTSGSSGISKIVCRTYSNILDEITSFLSVVKFTSKDIILCTTPLYHAYGFLNGFLVSFFNGLPLVISESLSIFNIIDCLQKYHVTIIIGTPFIYNILIDIDIEVKFLSLRWCFSAGDKISLETIEKFETIFKTKIIQQYGTTETGVISVNLNNSSNEYIHSVGKPIVGREVNIINQTGEKLPNGYSGEIIISGKCLSMGYLHFHELNQKKFKDGWYYTEDIGMIDVNYNLHITGRKNLTIIVAGLKVDPVEVERVIMLHEGVKECIVIGTPDEKYGQIVKAFLVLNNNEVTKTAIFNLCKKMLADYKIPKKIIFLDELPKSPTGKILRKHLIDK